MSKTKKSESRSHSRSASRSRCRSDSRSRSRSRSSPRPRSRKRRYGSRSRSRSHSPSHNRERNHTREYQNQREFRGNHRGFRRPYYFRGRGQGFFRGRFQRGGRGGYNNYHPKNWQNFRQHHQQQQQQQQQQQYHPNSPKRGHSRSRSPKKQSKSPQSRSHSRRSDRSSSGRSPQSHHSSSSNSGSAKHSCKDLREDISVPEETRGGGDGALAEQVGGSPAAEENSDGDRTVEESQVLTNRDTSPKRASPQVFSTVTSDQLIDSATNETSPAQNAPSKGATTWKSVETAPSNTSPIKKSFTPVFNSFGLYSNIDQQTNETTAMSTAFALLKFLEEQKLKKQASAWDNNTHKGKSNGDIVCDQENGEIIEKGIELSRTVDYDMAGKEKSRSAKSGDGNKLSISSAKRGSQNRLTFQCEDGEDDDEEMEISNRVRDMENDPCKSKVTLSAREMFERHIRRMQDMALDDELEALLLCHKQERAANILAALSKRDQFSGMFKDPSPEKLSNVNPKEKSSSKPTLLPRRSSENREQEMFVVMNDESPPRASMKRSEFSVRMDSLRTPALTNERRNLLDFLHLDKKDWEFQSVLQHLQAQLSPKSPSELFAQHIVSIVHHIKAQYFPSSGLSLNDRFAMYQRRAAEKEFMKQRKSPEIHRRIDVSPSAFKRHALLIDEMKSSMENSFKVDGKKSKGDSMDLRLDIESRKKYLSGEREHREEEYGGRVSRKSPDASKEITTEKVSKNHKKFKKSKKKREHSESSSSSFSSVYHEKEAEIKAEGFSKVQQELREYGEPAERRWARGGFQLRRRGRNWNRGNFHGSSNGDSQMNMPEKNDDWDQEYTPKSKKYFLSERDGEAEKKMIYTRVRGRGRGNAIRGKGRFILRRATNTNPTNNTSPKWAHDKFQATDEDEGEQQGEDVEQDQ
ncbi:thyroid hormone receptor-associated protein 3 isoform X3 [Carassius gibelio]|uniref:thyroid hormone receptor-associated protein 3 isoform X3 n=1 Tax=Carassius gibelio TaxID=101364 RepID=UPI002277A363|nr:thyroid hormone receptor-associated protein 3 isoform X3 [Carassius gibelio]